MTLRVRPQVTTRLRVRRSAGIYEEPMTIRHLASNLIELVAPLDESAVPPAPIVTITSCTGRLYDATVSFLELPSTTLAEELDVGEVAVDIPNAFGFQSGATVELTMVSGTVHRTTIAGIAFGAASTDVDTITLTAGPTEKVAPQTELRQVAYLTGVTALAVRHPERFAIGETVSIRDATDVRVERAITGISRRYLLVAAIAAAVNAPQPIERKLGADLTLAAYNIANAAAATDDWGYRATIPHTQAELRPGILVTAEVELVTAALRTIERLTIPVLGR